MIDAQERIEKAVRLQWVDRVPVVPIIDSFASHYGGITQYEKLFDVAKADAALERTIQHLGRIDGQHITYSGLGNLLCITAPNPPLLPGCDGRSPYEEWQFVERSIMEPSEYRDIAVKGPFTFLNEKLQINHPFMRTRAGVAKALLTLAGDARRLIASARRWERKGVVTMIAPMITFTPIEYIALQMRSFNDFMLDLYRHKDDIKDASAAIMSTLKMMGLVSARVSGIKRVFMGGARTGATIFSPKLFEELALPEWQEMAEYYVARGITPVLHMDSDWTAFYPYLKELPARSCVLNLDGSSDIFKAKEVLGDHMCIMGDMPATLLKLGTPDEVDDYCRRLITEVGAGGGFILSSGCTVPIDARPENVAAMLSSVINYGAPR